MSVCSTDRKNLGLYDCALLPGRIVSMITTPDNFRVPKATAKGNDAGKVTAFQAAIFSPSNRIYLWPPFFNFENQSTDPAYEQGMSGRAPVDDGVYSFRPLIKQNMCVHRAMFSHRSNGGRVMFVDKFNKLLGTWDSNGDWMGLRYSMIHTEKLRLSDGTNSTLSPITIDIEDSQEIDQFGDLIDARFVKSLIRIVDAQITQVGVASATTIVVDVIVECDETPVTGLIAADFLVKNPDGTTKAVTSIIEDVAIKGRYTITGTGFLTLTTVQLKSADLLSIDGYESPLALTVVI
jgi:hypothetical protein